MRLRGCQQVGDDLILSSQYLVSGAQPGGRTEAFLLVGADRIKELAVQVALVSVSCFLTYSCTSEETVLRK